MYLRLTYPLLFYSKFPYYVMLLSFKGLQKERDNNLNTGKSVYCDCFDV